MAARRTSCGFFPGCFDEGRKQSVIPAGLFSEPSVSRGIECRNSGDAAYNVCGLSRNRFFRSCNLDSVLTPAARTHSLWDILRSTLQTRLLSSLAAHPE